MLLALLFFTQRILSLNTLFLFSFYFNFFRLCCIFACVGICDVCACVCKRWLCRYWFFLLPSSIVCFYFCITLFLSVWLLWHYYYYYTLINSRLYVHEFVRMFSCHAEGFFIWLVVRLSVCLSSFLTVRLAAAFHNKISFFFSYYYYLSMRVHGLYGCV